LLEKLQHQFDSRGYLGFLTAPRASLPAADPEALLAREFSVLNGTWRLLESDLRSSAYYLFHFRYDAIADDRREGLLLGVVRPDGQGIARLTAGLEPDRNPAGCRPACDEAELRAAYQVAVPLAEWRVRQALRDFETSLGQRLRRDQRRVREYFAELDAQIERRRERKKDDAELQEKVRAQQQTLRLECRRQLLDLIDKARPEVKLSLLAAARVGMTVRRFEVEIRRRSHSLRRVLAWNPVDRALDALPCQNCGGATLSIAVCDERLHLVCRECYPECPRCRHGYCRKCHPGGCPRETQGR
jgi:hypothetical protein